MSWTELHEFNLLKNILTLIKDSCLLLLLLLLCLQAYCLCVFLFYFYYCMNRQCQLWSLPLEDGQYSFPQSSQFHRHSFTVFIHRSCFLFLSLIFVLGTKGLIICYARRWHRQIVVPYLGYTVHFRTICEPSVMDAVQNALRFVQVYSLAILLLFPFSPTIPFLVLFIFSILQDMFSKIRVSSNPILWSLLFAAN